MSVLSFARLAIGFVILMLANQNLIVLGSEAVQVIENAKCEGHAMVFRCRYGA